MGKSFKKNANALFVNQFELSEEPITETPAKVEIAEPKQTISAQEPIKENVGGWEQVEKKEQRYNKHINLMVQEFTRDKLDEYAKADGKSRNDLINTILKKYITERG